MRIHVDGASFDVDIKAEQLAEVFINMSSVERAQFINALGEGLKEPEVMWFNIMTNDALTDDGVGILNAINEAKLMLAAEEYSIGRKWQE